MPTELEEKRNSVNSSQSLRIPNEFNNNLVRNNDDQNESAFQKINNMETNQQNEKEENTNKKNESQKTVNSISTNQNKWPLRRIIAIIVFPLVTVGIGFIIGISANTQIDSWYQTINKPSFTPPNQIFAPAWTVFYLSIGFSGFFAWDKKMAFVKEHWIAWTVYICHLIVNYIWTPLFFGLHLIFEAGVEIIFMWLFIVANIILFCRIDLKAGLIMLPYLGWVTFATALNWGFFVANRETMYPDTLESNSLLTAETSITNGNDNARFLADSMALSQILINLP